MNPHLTISTIREAFHEYRFLAPTTNVPTSFLCVSSRVILQPRFKGRSASLALSSAVSRTRSDTPDSGDATQTKLVHGTIFPPEGSVGSKFLHTSLCLKVYILPYSIVLGFFLHTEEFFKGFQKLPILPSLV